jgi:hypothetical protein
MNLLYHRLVANTFRKLPFILWILLADSERHPVTQALDPDEEEIPTYIRLTPYPS